MNATKKQSEEDINQTEHDKAFQELIKVIDNDVLYHKKAVCMSTLLQKFRFFLPKDLADKYASSKLQRRLQIYYGDAVVIQTQK